MDFEKASSILRVNKDPLEPQGKEVKSGSIRLKKNNLCQKDEVEGVSSHASDFAEWTK